MKNRYLAIAFDHYEAAGGLGDVKSRHDDVEEAMAAVLTELVSQYAGDTGYVYDRQEDRILRAHCLPPVDPPKPRTRKEEFLGAPLAALTAPRWHFDGAEWEDARSFDG